MTSNQEDGSKKELPAGYVLRALEVGDYNKGFMELLSNLTTVGNVSMDMFLERYNRMKETTLYHPFVIVDLHTAKVVATAWYVSINSCLLLSY